MIKDIVVKLSVGERASPAEDYAVSIAATFDAHLTGIAFLYYPIVPVAELRLHSRRHLRFEVGRRYHPP